MLHLIFLMVRAISDIVLRCFFCLFFLLLLGLLKCTAAEFISQLIHLRYKMQENSDMCLL